MISFETAIVVCAILFGGFLLLTIRAGVVYITPFKVVRRSENSPKFWLYVVVSILSLFLAVYLVLRRA